MWNSSKNGLRMAIGCVLTLFDVTLVICLGVDIESDISIAETYYPKQIDCQTSSGVLPNLDRLRLEYNEYA